MIKRSSTPNSENKSADLSSIVENHDEAFSEDESVYGTLPARLSNGASSMPNLLDEQMYHEGHNCSSTLDLQSNNSSFRVNGTSNCRFIRYCI